MLQVQSQVELIKRLNNLERRALRLACGMSKMSAKKLTQTLDKIEYLRSKIKGQSDANGS